MHTTTASFDEALTWLLVDEGTQFVNNPNDRGGPTMCGITLRSWGEFCGHPVTEAELRALSLEDVRRFYGEVYWAPLGLGTWHRVLAIATFDIAVVCGTGRAMVMAQSAMGVAADGIPGPKTQHAASPAIADPWQFLLRFVPHVALRFAAIIKANPSQAEFAPAWIGRAMRLLHLGGPCAADAALSLVNSQGSCQ